MKMGIIGYGSMAHWHKDFIDSKISGLTIKGIYDIDGNACMKAKYDNLKVYGSQKELFHDPEISFVLVATPNHLHKSIAIDGMRAGKSIICEKPIATSSNDLSEMLEVSKETGMFLTVHQNRRWDKDFCTVKKIIDDGTIGNIFRIESRVHGAHGISDTWRRKKYAGGGVLLDWGVHLFDQILLLKKGVHIREVYAVFSNITTTEVEDGFTAFLTFEDGLQCIVETSTNNFIQSPRWYICGTSGTVEVNDWNANGKIIQKVFDEDDTAPVITASAYTKTMAPRSKESIVERCLPVVNPDISEFYRNVMDVINGKSKPIIQVDEIINVIRLMEAVSKSAKTHKTVFDPLKM